MPGKIAALLLFATSISSASAAPTDCARAIAQFRRVVDSDAATGNLERSVYRQMQPDLAQTVGLCRSGHDAEALRELRSLKSRFGYH